MNWEEALTRLIVALDVSKEEGLRIARKLARLEKPILLKLNSIFHDDLSDTSGPRLISELGSMGFRIWIDAKLHDTPGTVKNSIDSYNKAGCPVDYISVHLKGEADMLLLASKAASDAQIQLIGVTELTSLGEEQVHLGSGHPVKASVLQLARLAKLMEIPYLVCSGQELETLSSRTELVGLRYFVPGLKLTAEASANVGQKRTMTVREAIYLGAKKAVVGSGIVKADDPIQALRLTVEEIQKGLEDRERS